MKASFESSSTSGKNQIPVSDAIRTIRLGLNRIDAERPAAFGDLITFQSAKRKLLERHENLLALKLGADHPRVLESQTRRAAIDAALGDLQTAQNVAETPMPEVEPTGYVLHGFIRDTQRQPVADVVVALYDATGARRSDFTPATPATDANGYFNLATDQLLETDDPANPSPDSIPLQLRVFAGRQRQLQISVPTINAVPGRIDFCELLAGDATPTPPTPPDKVSVRTSSSAGSKATSNPAAGLQMMTKELRKASPRIEKTAKTSQTQTGSTKRGASKTSTPRAKPPARKKTRRKRAR